MTVETATDRAALLADWDTASFNGDTIRGILSNEFAEIAGGVGIESDNPTFLCLSEDVAGAKHGNSIFINGDHYRVVGVQPDGTGFTTLVLEEQ